MSNITQQIHEVTDQVKAASESDGDTASNAYNGSSKIESQSIPTLDHTIPSDADTLIGGMPVSLSIELGTVLIDATNADALRPGNVLDVTTNCPGQVKISCNGHEVGRGELVDINGRLGLQILHKWSHSCR